MAVLTVVVAVIVITSVLGYTIYHSNNTPISNNFSLSATGQHNVNITVNSTWAVVNESSSNNQWKYAELTIYVTAENNLTTNITGLGSCVSDLSLSPIFKTVSLWGVTSFGVTTRVSIPIAPGQKQQMVFQLFVSSSRNVSDNISQETKAANNYYHSNEMNYTWLYWDSSAFEPIFGGHSYKLTIVNESNRESPVDFYGTYLNITDNIQV